MNTPASAPRLSEIEKLVAVVQQTCAEFSSVDDSTRRKTNFRQLARYGRRLAQLANEARAGTSPPPALPPAPSEPAPTGSAGPVAAVPETPGVVEAIPCECGCGRPVHVWRAMLRAPSDHRVKPEFQSRRYGQPCGDFIISGSTGYVYASLACLNFINEE